MLFLETDSFVAESRVDFSTPFLVQSMNSRPKEGAIKTLTHRYNGKKSDFHITAFEPHVLHKQDNHHFLYASKKGPYFLVTEHLFDRMLERGTGFKNSLDAKLTLISHISNRCESLKAYWFGQENQIILRSSIGAYLGEAIKIDQIQYYWLKTFLSNEKLSQKLADPWKWKKLDTQEIVSMEKEFIQKANGIPFNSKFF